MSTVPGSGPLSELEFHAIDRIESLRREAYGALVAMRAQQNLLEFYRQLSTAADQDLQGRQGLSRETSHALIGKYVYLHYLRDREILSDTKLREWGIAKFSVFGGTATLGGLTRVVEKLDEWLNGSVFPIGFAGQGAPEAEHVQWVAGVFAGGWVEPLPGLCVSAKAPPANIMSIRLVTMNDLITVSFICGSSLCLSGGILSKNTMSV